MSGLTRSRMLGCAVVLFATACTHGPSLASFAPAQGHVGAEVDYRLRTLVGAQTAELIAVDSNAVIVAARRITRIEWSELRQLSVFSLGGQYRFRGGAVTPELVQRLRLVSRFPYGIPAGVLEQLLEARVQQALDEIPGRRDVPPAASADPSSSAIDVLAAATASATTRFADRRVAIAEGYKRVGDDFPGMGEHWVHAGMLLEGALNVSRPTILTYAAIEGSPRLIGTGFIVTTRDDEPHPTAPGWPESWHEHSGLFAEESAGAHHANHSRGGTRVWVLHIWTALPNPAGKFKADNWALPFARLGLTPPAKPDESAARALSLISGGDAHFRAVLERAGTLGDHNRAAIDDAVSVARENVAAVAGRSRAVGSVLPDDLTLLRREWERLQARIGIDLR